MGVTPMNSNTLAIMTQTKLPEPLLEHETRLGRTIFASSAASPPSLTRGWLRGRSRDPGTGLLTLMLEYDFLRRAGIHGSPGGAFKESELGIDRPPIDQQSQTMPDRNLQVALPDNRLRESAMP